MIIQCMVDLVHPCSFSVLSDTLIAQDNFVISDVVVKISSINAMDVEPGMLNVISM